MPELVKLLKPKQWLQAVTLLFALIFCITVPQSVSAPFLFLKNIEIGSVEFVNTFGLIRDLSLAVLFAGLYVSMLAILSSIINIDFNELIAIVAITTVIATILWGIPGLFVLSFIYYCRETREFIDKMKEADPKSIGPIGVTITFMIIGILGGLWAARSQLYFEPSSLEFAKGFGKVWLGCDADQQVTACLDQNAQLGIGYSLLLKKCEPLAGESKMTCLQKVESTKQDAYDALVHQYEQMGDIQGPVGEFTVRTLAQYLNTWVGLLPNESRFVLALITFSLITTVGFVLEMTLPIFTSLLMDIFIGYKIIYTYEKEEKPNTTWSLNKVY